MGQQHKWLTTSAQSIQGHTPNLGTKKIVTKFRQTDRRIKYYRLLSEGIIGPGFNETQIINIHV